MMHSFRKHVDQGIVYYSLGLYFKFLEKHILLMDLCNKIKYKLKIKCLFRRFGIFKIILFVSLRASLLIVLNLVVHSNMFL